MPESLHVLFADTRERGAVQHPGLVCGSGSSHDPAWRSEKGRPRDLTLSVRIPTESSREPTSGAITDLITQLHVRLLELDDGNLRRDTIEPDEVRDEFQTSRLLTVPQNGTLRQQKVPSERMRSAFMRALFVNCLETVMQIIDEDVSQFVSQREALAFGGVLAIDRDDDVTGARILARQTVVTRRKIEHSDIRSHKSFEEFPKVRDGRESEVVCLAGAFRQLSPLAFRTHATKPAVRSWLLASR